MKKMKRECQRFISIVSLASMLFSFVVVGHPLAGIDNAQHSDTIRPSEPPAGMQRINNAGMPLIFEENRGQTDRQVKFVSRAPGHILYLTNDGATFSLKVAGDVEKAAATNKFERAKIKTRSEKLRMRFAGSNPKVRVSGTDVAVTKTNYYIGKKRLENLSNYKRVEYKDLYQGVDAVFYGNNANRLEYDFVVAPGTDTGQIRLSFEGARSLAVGDDGSLVARTDHAELRQQKPFAYQSIDGKMRAVDVRYAVDGNDVTFHLGDYDRSQPLTIDPALEYLTYIGGTSFDQTFEVATDPQFNAYITGSTASLDFHGETRVDADGKGAFAAKINADGTAFVYITVLEGNADDFGVGIAVDSGNQAYLAGLASHDFPTTSGAFDTNHGSVNTADAFVTKLNANGNISYSTFIGGSDHDQAFDVAVDAGGKAYVVGETFSTQFFPTKNRYQGCGVFYPQSLNSLDAFLTVFNAQGSDITYSTCIGGNVTTDSAFSVALDSSNNAYLTGVAHGGNFPTKNAAQPESGGGIDAWIAKFNATQSGEDSLIYSTYLGGSGTEKGFSMAVTPGGVANVTGVTGSTNFPLLNAFDSLNQINEAFVAQYNSSGTKLNATFIGGADQDEGMSIATGNGGTIYVCGSTLSNNFQTAVPFQSARRGLRDAFVTKIRFGINSNPGVSSSSYLGGNGNDECNGIAVRGTFIYIGGETQSNNLLTTPGVIKQTSSASATNPDGYVAKILDTRKETIGTFDPVDTVFDLRNTLTSGPADIVVNRGVTGDVGVAGDFNGDGIDTVSTFNNGVWTIRNLNVIVSGIPAGPQTVNFGQSGDLPVVGDWNGDGLETVGVYRPSVGDFLLTNDPTSVSNPLVAVTVDFGIAEDLPIAGDWDGDGIDSVAVFRPSVGQFFITNDNVTAATIDLVAFFGISGDLPVGGDWDGDGKDSIGVWRQSTLEFFLSNDNSSIANQFVFGAAGDRPVVGDWDGKPNQ